MQTEIFKIKRQQWDGRKWQMKREPSEIEGERTSEYFAIHRSVEYGQPYKYTVSHIKTGWALCRVKTKVEARKAARLALNWPGIDWATLTAKASTTDAVRSIGTGLLLALAEAGLAADIRVVNGQPKRILFT